MSVSTALLPKCHDCPRAAARAMSNVEFPACYVPAICQDDGASAPTLESGETRVAGPVSLRERKKIREAVHDLRGLAYSLNLLRSLALLHEDPAQQIEAWRWAHERIFSVDGRDRIDALLAQLHLSMRCELPGTSLRDDVECYLDSLNDTVSRVGGLHRPSRG